MLSVGICTLAADQPGDAKYLAATRVTQDVAINSAVVLAAAPVPTLTLWNIVVLASLLLSSVLGAHRYLWTTEVSRSNHDA